MPSASFSTYLLAPGTSQMPDCTLWMAGVTRPMANFLEPVTLLPNGASVTVEEPVDHQGTCQSTMKLFTGPPVLIAWVT